MKLRCPNDPDHKEFVVTAMVPEIWLLNEDGDCEDAWANDRAETIADFTEARCQECSVLVVIEEE